MITLKNASSLGCVDYGNNNFFEVMKDNDGTIGFMSHEEPANENPDGTYRGEADSLDKFIEDIKDRDDFADIVKDVILTISR